jgi:hypothetical protein
LRLLSFGLAARRDVTRLARYEGQRRPEADRLAGGGSRSLVRNGRPAGETDFSGDARMTRESTARSEEDRTGSRSEIREDGVPFGAGFFLRQLGAFVQESCSASPGLPLVQIHLAGGEVLKLCHVIAIAPGWIALAVHEAAGGREVRTELVPYAFVVRVTIRPSRDGSRIGFDAARAPEILGRRSPSPEEALVIAAGLPAEDPATPR